MDQNFAAANRAEGSVQLMEAQALQGNQLSAKQLGEGDGLENVAKANRVDLSDHDHGHVITSMGWYTPYSNRTDLQHQAQQNFELIRSQCVYWERTGKFNDFPLRWTNCPQVFPLDKVESSPNQGFGFFSSPNQPRQPDPVKPYREGGIVPFPPHDQQYYIQGIYDRTRSNLTESAIPSRMPDAGNNSAWMRLSEFAQTRNIVRLFAEMGSPKNHYGRVFQGALNTGYLVEALNAITLRPTLVKHLFYKKCYDVTRAIYIARLFMYGSWHRIELDDYVPVGDPPETSDENVPICCRSEHFPLVLWPSLVEKAYAKLFTYRAKPTCFDSTPLDKGGWEAIGGGGRVEDALVLLTGGVAGRFRTDQITADRLFVYLYEMQRDTLFVCRVNQKACDMFGVRLNPYYSYSVNRATPWEGRLYVQLFCAAPTVYDGGLQDISVPYSLQQCKDFPETEGEGFFWCDVNDFHLYFDTIIECHLTNTPECAIPGMPPPRLPPQMPHVGFSERPVTMFDEAKAVGYQHLSEEGDVIPFFEAVLACKGEPIEITIDTAPEFDIVVPDQTEVYLSFDQRDRREGMVHAGNPRPPASIMIKVYERFDGNLYNNPYVAKSNWLPINHSMAAFRVKRGGRFLVEVCFPAGKPESISGAIFRCYSTKPGVIVTGFSTAGKKRHGLISPEQSQITAEKLTPVGSEDPREMENPDDPTPFDADEDGLRRSEEDVNTAWKDLKEDCSIM
jgi:hypothetical protein